MPKAEMTAQWVERVKAPETGREEWFDHKVPGLGLRVSKRGTKTNKVWFVLFRVKGDPTKRRLTLDPFPQLSLADARERALEAIANANKGSDLARAKQEDRKAPTFETVASEYIERYAKKHKQTWQLDQQKIAKDLLPAWGRLKIQDVRRRNVQDVLDRIIERGSPVQANRTLAVARQVFNFAIDREYIEANPCARVKAPTDESERQRVLSEDEVRRLWAAWDLLDPVVGGTFKIQLLSAQRGGEVRSMRWADLDLSSGWWTIPAEVAKNGLSHRVPITEPISKLLEELRSRSGEQEWVFPSRMRRGLPLNDVRASSDKAAAHAGVLDFRPHDLRRTAASLMGSLGTPRLVISKVLNHIDQGVTRIYDRHSYDAEKRQALETWAAKLLEILYKEG